MRLYCLALTNILLVLNTLRLLIKQVRKLNWIAEHELSLLSNVNFIIFI